MRARTSPDDRGDRLLPVLPQRRLAREGALRSRVRDVERPLAGVAPKGEMARVPARDVPRPGPDPGTAVSLPPDAGERGDPRNPCSDGRRWPTLEPESRDRRGIDRARALAFSATLCCSSRSLVSYVSLRCQSQVAACSWASRARVALAFSSSHDLTRVVHVASSACI